MKKINELLEVLDAEEEVFSVEDTMYNYREKELSGNKEYFGPIIKLEQVAGNFRQQKNKELFDFYGGIIEAIEDYIENENKFASWELSFEPVTYGEFITYLESKDYIPKTTLADIEELIYVNEINNLEDLFQSLKRIYNVYSRDKGISKDEYIRFYDLEVM